MICVKEAHIITCYTCKDTFRSFSGVIEHRRENHPSTRKCNNFPECVNRDKCLYIHKGLVEKRKDETAHSGEAQANETRLTCITCKVDFSDKNEMMVHRKREHPNDVGLCKNILSGINCRKGPENYWYRHEPNRSPRSTL